MTVAWCWIAMVEGWEMVSQDIFCSTDLSYRINDEYEWERDIKNDFLFWVLTILWMAVDSLTDMWKAWGGKVSRQASG